MSTCDLQPGLLEKIEKFRFDTKNKGSSAFIIKIDRDNLLIEEDEVLSNVSLEDLQESLPDNRSRYVILSYEFKHKDGRVSYPLLFIFYSPTTVKTEENMLYASAKVHLQQAAGITKIYDIEEASALTEAALDKWLTMTLTRP